MCVNRFFRIAVSPVIYNLVMSGNYELALYLNLFSAVSDFLDGKIARTWPSQQSTLGELSIKAMKYGNNE